ncbi:MAG TPA: hypothetical protein V6D12_13780 [Candidatus Obscuribacterales bacterium]
MMNENEQGAIAFNQNTALTLLNSPESFPVDFDDAWQWLGYASKRNGKDTLINNFLEGVDFLRSSTKSPTGGRPSEFIQLTIDCFKMLGMMAGTEKGKEIRAYFLECEKIAKQPQAAPQIQPDLNDNVEFLNTVIAALDIDTERQPSLKLAALIAVAKTPEERAMLEAAKRELEQRTTPKPRDVAKPKSPYLLKVLEWAKEKGSIKVRDVQLRISAKHRPNAETIRLWFSELVAMGKGSTQGEGRSMKFSAKVDEK